jgi:hypothetical protein
LAATVGFSGWLPESNQLVQDRKLKAGKKPHCSFCNTAQQQALHITRGFFGVCVSLLELLSPVSLSKGEGDVILVKTPVG